MLLPGVTSGPFLPPRWQVPPRPEGSSLTCRRDDCSPVYDGRRLQKCQRRASAATTLAPTALPPRPPLATRSQPLPLARPMHPDGRQGPQHLLSDQLRDLGANPRRAARRRATGREERSHRRRRRQQWRHSGSQRRELHLIRDALHSSCILRLAGAVVAERLTPRLCCGCCGWGAQPTLLQEHHASCAPSVGREGAGSPRPAQDAGHFANSS